MCSFLSVQFSCSVMSDSLLPHGLQHARLSCPSPTPKFCSNSCPSSWWCHPTISSSVVPFSSCLQSFPASGSFPMTLLEGTSKTLCAPGSRRKEQWPHKRLTQTCLWASRSLWQRHGSAVPCCRVRGNEWGSACTGPLKEVTIIFITTTMFWSQVKQQGGNTAPPITENWIKDLLSMALPIRTRPNFPLSQSLPSGSFHKLLILCHQRADKLKTTITEN